MSFDKDEPLRVTEYDKDGIPDYRFATDEECDSFNHPHADTFDMDNTKDKE